MNRTFLQAKIMDLKKGLSGLFLLVLLVCGKSITGWCADYPNQVIKTIAGTTSPYGAAITPDGSYVYVTNYSGDGMVSVIDTSDNAVIGTPISVGSSPRDIVIDGNHAYVTNTSDDTVSVINTSDNIVTDTITVGDGPEGVAVTPDGNYVYVTNHYGDTVSVIGEKDLYATGDFGSLPIGPLAASVSALLAWWKRQKQK